MDETHYLVPRHIGGTEKDITFSISAEDIEDADDWFVDAKDRLLDVNNWQEYIRNKDVRFRLADDRGRNVDRPARRGDHIKIFFSDGANFSGDFDWATIEAMEYDDYPDNSAETFAIRVHPSIDPQVNSGETPILLPDGASGTFVVARVGKELSVTYHGRNEQAHISREQPDEKACWMGLTTGQWNDLVKGMLQ
jgi:hypothetical protein